MLPTDGLITLTDRRHYTSNTAIHRERRTEWQAESNIWTERYSEQ